MRMRTSVMFTALAYLCGLTGMAQAGQIHSPAIYGSLDQTGAVCSIRNIATTATVSVTARIFNDEGTERVTTGCFTALAPGESCSVGTPISDQFAYACSVTVPGSTKDLRATLIILSDFGDGPNTDLLNSVELR